MSTPAYNAFISYSHDADGELAAAIERGLKRFAKPIFRRRALEVFRDDAALSANPGLWSAIENALLSSEYLILLACTEAAHSQWVDKELDSWCQRRGAGRILIVVTAGNVVWDDDAADFDWARSSALPQRLRGVFSEEPRWIDLRWVRSERDLTLENPRFRDAVADLAAPLHGRAKDDIVGEDVVQHRRLRRVTRAVGVALLALVIALTASLMFAVSQRNEAETQAERAEHERIRAEQRRDDALRTQSLFLADLSKQKRRAGDETTAALLALRALPRANDRPYVAQAESALRAALLTLREQRVLRGPHASTHSATLTPDGETIVAATERTLQLWNAHSGEPVRTIDAHEEKINDVAVSPDGRYLLSASDDGTVAVWDAATGRRRQTLDARSGEIWSVAVSSDGARIAAGASNGTVHLWDGATFERVNTLSGHRHWVRSVSFSDDARRVASASNDGTVRIWRADDGELAATLEVSEEWVLSAAFSRDGKRVVTGSADPAVRVWEVDSGQLLATFEGHTQPVSSVSFSSADRWLLSASLDGSVRLWDATSSGRALVAMRGHDSMIYSARFTHDDDRILSASGDGTVRLWSTARVPGVATLSAHPSRVMSAAFSADGSQLAAGFWDGAVVIWTVRSGSIVRTLTGHADAVTSLAFSADGERLVSASRDQTLRIWRVASAETLRVLRGHRAGLTSVAFSPDGEQVVSTSKDGTVRLWRAESGAPLHVLNGNAAEVWRAGFSHDGARVVSASDDGGVRVWDASSGALVSTLTLGDSAAAFAAFAPDDQRLIAASGITVSIWDVASANRVLTKRLGAPVYTARFDVRGRRVVSATAMGTVRVWHAGSGDDAVILRWGEMHAEQIAPGIPGLVEPVRDALFSPDGRAVAFVSRDETVRVWFVGGSLDDLIAFARSKLPRCLTVAQEKQFFLRASDDDTPVDPLRCRR